MTQGEFGSLFGVSRDNIASYERGSEPKVDFIARLVEYFGISYDDFIGTSLGANTDIFYNQANENLEVRELSRDYVAAAGVSQAGRGSEWQNIPVYELSPATRLSSLFLGPQSFQPVDYFAASTLPHCDGGIRISGDGMAPLLQSGDVVFYRQVNDIHNSILWGELYLLSFEMDGNEYTAIKYLYKSGHPGYVRLAGPGTHHSHQEVALHRIRALGLVMASFRRHTLP